MFEVYGCGDGMPRGGHGTRSGPRPLTSAEVFQIAGGDLVASISTLGAGGRVECGGRREEGHRPVVTLSWVVAGAE